MTTKQKITEEMIADEVRAAAAKVAMSAYRLTLILKDELDAYYATAKKPATDCDDASHEFRAIFAAAAPLVQCLDVLRGFHRPSLPVSPYRATPPQET